ncbi:MAG: hypothetical protein HQL12_02680 [Candidatus Omnitrophica bacterium]|nr:hypothetical protein [Candidatus Omnitrophota bacterium]
MKFSYLRTNKFQKFILLCAGLFIFLFFFNPIETGDVWWHLSTGKWIVDHWQVPHEDVFPFAHEKTPWLCNNEWLGSLLLYLIVKTGGLLGLKVFRSLFFVFIIGILFFYSCRRLPFSLLIILILLETFGIANRGFLRPDIFNILFIQILFISLFDYEDSGNCKKLWALPVLSLIWFNIHLGGFIYSLLLLFIFFLSACIRYFNLNSGHCNAGERLNAKIQIKSLALTAFGCLAGFIFNPYGIEGFLYPFKVFLQPNFIGYYKLTTLVSEMQPPGYLFTSFHFFYYFILLAAGVLVIFFNKKNNFTFIILLLFSLGAFFYMQRNSYFFSLVCAYVIAAGAKRINFNDVWRSLRCVKLIEGVLFTGIVLFLLIQIISLWFQKSYYNGQLVNTRSLIVSPVSEAPIKLLIKHKITGPVFDSDILGGQIIWLGYPDLRPFVDGRNSSKERLNNAMAILYHPKEVWPTAQRDYNFKIVILNSFSDSELSLLKYLGTQATWQLISVNGLYVTYVKRGEFKLSKELDNFEEFLKTHDVSGNDLRSLKSLAGGTNPSVLKEIFLPSADNNGLYLNFVSLYRLGFTGAAVENLVKASKAGDRAQVRNTAVFVLKQLNMK